jgi:hypothetical protein
MANPKGPRSWPPGIFFSLDVLVLIVLFGVALGFATGVLPELRPAGRPGAAFLSVIPYWVPWAGALGGVSISLVGVAGYADDRWNPKRYAYWHLARPFLGAMFGTIAVLIVVLVLKNVATVDTRVPLTPQGTAVLCVFAFVVGFREETFRSLLLRVVDVILGPGTSDTTALVAFVPAVLDFGLVAPGVAPPPSGKVHLFNGSGDSLHVTQANIACGDPSLRVDPPIADTTLAPAQSLEMTIVWTPPVGARPLSSYVSVTAGNRSTRLTVVGGVR